MVDSDDKFILALITHIKRPKAQDNKVTYYAKNTLTNPQQGAYNRSFDFGDLSDTSGSVGRVIFDTNPCNQLTPLCNKGASAIGSIVLLVEPEWNSTMGADHVPIFHLHHKDSVVPMGMNLTNFATSRFAMTLRQDVPILPLSVSDTRYFYYSNVAIHVNNIEFKKSCNGVLCDRTSQSSECFCLTKSVNTGVTMSCNLFFSESYTKPLNEWYVNKKYTSYSFMCIFISPEMKFEELDSNLVKLRTFITKRVHSINKRGGAQIFGWYRQGLKEGNIETKTDAISGGNKEKKKVISDSNKVVSEDINPHVSSVVLNNAKYSAQKKFRYEPDNFVNLNVEEEDTLVARRAH